MNAAGCCPDVETPCRASAPDFRPALKELGAELAGVRASLRATLLAARKQGSAMRAEIDAATQRKPKAERLRCGARCRDGHACVATPVWHRDAPTARNGRCRMHGGLSTGPRTPEGKERVRAAARRTMLERWRERREGAAG
jgi:hypothetical protein